MQPDAEQEFAVDGPLDVVRTLSSLALGRNDPTVAVDQDGSFWRATWMRAGPVTWQALPVSGGAVVRAWGPGAEGLLERAPDLLGLNDDPSGLVPHHPVVRDLQKRAAGVRLSRGSAVFEVLLPTIIGQRVLGKEGELSWKLLVRALGEVAPGPAGLRLPPRPGALLRLPRYELHRFGIEAKRAAALQEAARVHGHVEAVAELAPEEAAERLRLIPGVGPWTSTITVALSMGWADAVPLGDANLPNTVAWILARERRADDTRMLELLEPYAGQRWRVVRLLKTSGIRAPRRGPRRGLHRDFLAYDRYGRRRS